MKKLRLQVPDYRFLSLALFLLIFGITVCVSTQTSAGTPAPSRSQMNQPELDIWNDPVFQKQFIAGYGINSEIEPRVMPEEVAILEKVRPLMAEDLPKAEVMLKKQMKPECSAILDFTLGGIQFQSARLPG